MRFLFIFFWATLLCVASLSGARAQTESLKPSRLNVLLLSIESFRADRLGSRTPHLDRLARESFVFRNAFANSSSPYQSHASMFTGLYVPFHGAVRTWESSRAEILKPPGINEGIRTLPELLRDAGRRTARFVYTRDFYLHPALGFGRGFDEFRPFGLDASWTAQEITDWIGPDSSASKPFFLFINSKRARAPYLIPRRLLPPRPSSSSSSSWAPFRVDPERFDQLLNELKILHVRSIPGIELDENVFHAQILKNRKRNLPLAMTLYDRAIELTDQYVGDLLERMSKLGLLENTLIIVTAPQGEEFFEHGGLSHLKLNRESVQVPLLIRVPRGLGIGSPRGVDAQVQAVDLLPTIAELADLPLHPVHGRSLVPLMKGSIRSLHEFTYARNSASFLRHASSVRSDRWKLILKERGEAELYDLTADPRETRNLASSRGDIARSLSLKIRELELELAEVKP